MVTVYQPLRDGIYPICPTDVLSVDIDNDLATSIKVHIFNMAGSVPTGSPAGTGDFPHGRNSREVGVDGGLPGKKWFSAFGGTFSTGYSFSAIRETHLCCPHHRVPLPAVLKFLDPLGVAAGIQRNTQQVNVPAQLIHSQDSNFPCYYFSRPIFGAEVGNPAHWILYMTPKKAWSLYFRRLSNINNEIALYQSVSEKFRWFPITFKRIRVGKEFKKWPAKIRIGPA